MADVDYRASLDGFIADLKRVWLTAGAPSYAQLEYLSTQMLRQHRSGDVRFMALAPSTTSEILSGQRQQALKWPWVLTFLTVLQVTAQQVGIDAAVVGTIDDWKRKHEAVLAAGQARLRPVPASRRERGCASVIDPAPALWTAAARDAGGGAEALLGAFLTVIRQAGLPQWRHGRDVAPDWLELYLTLQSGAELIRMYETEVIPGLLQAESYARAVMGQRLPGASADETARLAGLRMQRQSLRRGQNPCRLWAIIEEAAFRSRLTDAQTMRVQVEYLIGLMDEGKVALQVVPSGTGGNLVLSEPMTIFRFPGRSLGDVVSLEQPDRALFLYEREDTDHYKQLFDSLAMKAPSPDITRRMLMRIRDGI